MHVEINKSEKIRVETYSGPFIDVTHVGYESLAVDIYGFLGYVELRKKDKRLRLFQFPEKSYKKDCDFEWWEDAEIVFSYNEKGKDA
jgi:hypothetical protein